jgi:hypothetical protein
MSRPDNDPPTNSSTLYVCVCFVCFVSFAYQGKDIVFRLIIEYSSLRDFGSLDYNIRSIFIWGFLKDDHFGLCWNSRLVT